MKKVWAWIVTALTAIGTVLALLLKIKSQQASAAQEDAAEAKAAAKHSDDNAEALAAHQGKVDGIKDDRRDRDEAIENGSSDDALDSIISANNNRVPDDD